jgi:Undecaprenyl-phosphate galactose phosphotransferase WbaP
MKPKESMSFNCQVWTDRIIRIAGDYLAIVAAELLASWIRNLIMGNRFSVDGIYLYFMVPLVFVVALTYARVYTKHFTVEQMLRHVFHACLGGIAFAIILMYLTKVSQDVSRLFVVIFSILSYMFLVIEKVALSSFLKKVPSLRIPILIIGAGKTADAIIKEFIENPAMNFRIIGFLEDYEPTSRYAGKYPVLGGFKDLEEVVKKYNVSVGLIAAPGMKQQDLNKLIYRAQSVLPYVSIVPNLVSVPMSNVEVESFFDSQVMMLNIRNNLAFKSNQIIKRIFDVVATIVGGILISPLLVLIAIWVYHDSPGPIFFKHRRIGKGGKEFNCYKFRSMCVNSQEVLEHLLKTDPAAREEWEREFKLKNDPRITKSGAFLRKTSLDELPQLLNVLKGEMSLVGPRPIVKKEIPKYGEYIREYYSVLPGITGMWQTSGRSDIDYPERVQMDSWYVHNWSIWLDLVLIWRTFGAVLKHKGAY